MIQSVPAAGKVGVASTVAAVTGLWGVAEGVTLDGSRLFEIIIGGALTLIGALLYAAWQDLKKRDDDAKRERGRLFARLDGVNVKIARMQERLRMAENNEDGD